jgi:elongation factor G
MGMTFEVIEIPEDLEDVVTERREILLEAVADYDETLLEKFFDDPDSISAEEIRNAIKMAVIVISSIMPIFCGSAFKNKGVQAVLDAVCAFLPSPVDVEAIEGTNPDTEEVEKRRSQQ